MKRLSKAVENDTTYLFNYTNEALAPGDVVQVGNDGRLLKVGTIDQFLPSADQARARAVLVGPKQPYTESQLVQRGTSLDITADGTPIPGQSNFTLAFGVGGGCFLDVTGEAIAALLASTDRLWLLQQAARVLEADQLLLTEVVESAYVASATSGWNAKLQLSVSANLPLAGLGSLAELKAKGKLDVTVKSGRVFLRQPSVGRPLFRAVRVEDVVDLVASPAFAPQAGVEGLETAHRHAEAVRVRTLREASVSDLGAFYELDDDE